MNGYRTWSLALTVSVLVATCAFAGDDPPDLLDYIAKIRESGMSEGAEGSLRSIASIRAGATILKYRKDDRSGRYWASYSSTACPLPGADPAKVAEWQATLRAKTSAEMDRLKPLADRDSSGFVSSEEAWELRELFEFGILAVQVQEAEGPGIQKLATASGLKSEDAESRLASYRVLAKKMPDEGEDAE